MNNMALSSTSIFAVSAVESVAVNDPLWQLGSNGD
jgi:hypothetical protein